MEEEGQEEEEREKEDVAKEEEESTKRPRPSLRYLRRHRAPSDDDEDEDDEDEDDEDEDDEDEQEEEVGPPSPHFLQMFKQRQAHSRTAAAVDTSADPTRPQPPLRAGEAASHAGSPAAAESAAPARSGAAVELVKLRARKAVSSRFGEQTFPGSYDRAGGAGSPGPARKKWKAARAPRRNHIPSAWGAVGDNQKEENDDAETGFETEMIGRRVSKVFPGLGELRGVVTRVEDEGGVHEGVLRGRVYTVEYEGGDSQGSSSSSSVA